MLAVSVVFWICRQVVLMAWFCYDHLRSVFGLIWRRICLVWRCFKSAFRKFIGFICGDKRRDNDVGRDDPVYSEDEEPRVGDGEGQYGAMARGVTAVDVNTEPGTGGPRREEEEEEERFPESQRWAGPSSEEEDEFSGAEFRVETTDELYCDYDSTWETGENRGECRGKAARSSRRSASGRNYKFSRFENAAQDMQNYRHGYPNTMQRTASTNDMPNLNFYLGRKASVPDDLYIHHFHNNWAGDYYSLEHVHTYIQWLFPLQEPGMNYKASPMTREEVKRFLQNKIAKNNLLKSYKLMLDFYGIELCDEETGEVKRASNWEGQFDNLNTHTHNNLRITRILKCLGTLGFAHYQAPLVSFFLEETLTKGQLPQVKESVLNYFVFAVLNKRERRHLLKFAYLHYQPKEEFVWCPKKIQMKWSELSSAQGRGMEWS